MRVTPRLLVEYAACDFGHMIHHPRDRWMWDFGRADELTKTSHENLGFLAAVGEQRATQLFAVLAAKFDPKVAAAYETIFQAWGGDVRERSLDLTDGKLRPREIDLDGKAGGSRCALRPPTQRFTPASIISTSTSSFPTTRRPPAAPCSRTCRWCSHSRR